MAKKIAEMHERLDRQTKRSADWYARYRARTAAQSIRIVTTRIRDIQEQYKKVFVPVAVWIRKKDLQIYKDRDCCWIYADHKGRFKPVLGRSSAEDCTGTNSSGTAPGTGTEMIPILSCSNGAKKSHDFIM